MVEKTMPVTGGCLCGAVRYEASEEPIWAAYCHCRMCQQAYGQVSGLFVKFEPGVLRFTRGEPKHFQSSAQAERSFCADCGSPFGMRYNSGPVNAVLVGTLDHPEDWPPNEDSPGIDGHLGMESRIPWDIIHDDMRCSNSDGSSAFVAAKEAAERGDE